MSQDLITYNDKVTGGGDPTGLWKDIDANEVKSIVNFNAQDIESRVENVVVVKTLSDLDDFLTAGIYNLPAGKYVFNGLIDFGTNRINLDTTDGFYVIDGNLSVVLYSGTTSFITTDKTGTVLLMKFLIISALTATALELADGNSLIIDFVVLDGCLLCLDIDNFSFVTINPIAMNGCVSGCLLNNIGTASIRLGQWVGTVDTGGVAFTLSGASSQTLIFDVVDARPAASESYLEITADYGGDTTIAGGVLTTPGGSFFSAASRKEDDVNVLVSSIKNVKNSTTTAEGHFSGNALETVIVTQNVPVPINAVWVDVSKERFSFDANGTYTYVGLEDVTVPVTLIATVNPVGGGTRDISLCLSKNGVPIPTSQGQASATSGAKSQIQAIALIPIITGDNIAGFVENNSGTQNVIVSVATIVI